MPLEVGQFKIGDLIMGPGTPFKIESIDIANYEINAQDFQTQTSDELRFGTDTLKPAPIQLTINVIANRALGNVKALVGDRSYANFNDLTIASLQKEWRAEDIRFQWGALKPLLFCGTDGITRQYYGRPGKFTYKMPRVTRSDFYQAIAEFRRADTFCYSDTEYFVTLTNSVVSHTRIRGDAASWVRFLITGPVTNPVINFGAQQLSLATVIPAGKVVEISSYPWSRRIINSDGLSLAAYNTSEDPYLDKIKFQAATPTQCSWTGTGFTGATNVKLFWRDAYQVMM
jgi:hypothetical protein